MSAESAPKPKELFIRAFDELITFGSCIRWRYRFNTVSDLTDLDSYVRSVHAARRVAAAFACSRIL